MSNAHAANLARLKPAKPKQSGDRWARFNAFIDAAIRDLPRSELAVYLVLYRHERNGVASASIRQIAEVAGVSRRHTNEAINRLVTRGLVEVVKTGKLNKGGSTYRLHCPPTGGQQQSSEGDSTVHLRVDSTVHPDSHSRPPTGGHLQKAEGGRRFAAPREGETRPRPEVMATQGGKP